MEGAIPEAGETVPGAPAPGLRGAEDASPDSTEQPEDRNARGGRIYTALKVYAPLVAVILAGALFLRATAEMLVRLLPGKRMMGGYDAELEMSNALSPPAIFFGIVMVVICGFCAGFLAGKLFKKRGILAGVIAGVGIVLIEMLMSLARVGSIARIIQFTGGKASFDWPFTFMLLVGMVAVSGFGGWTGSGLGLQRSSLSSTYTSTIGVCMASVVALGALFVAGLVISGGRSYPAKKVQSSLDFMDNTLGWKADVRYVKPDKKSRRLALIEYDYEIGCLALIEEPTAYHFVRYTGEGFVSPNGRQWIIEQPCAADITTLPRDKHMTITGKWSGYWDGKEIVCEEFECPSSDFPFILTLAGGIQGVSATAGGSDELDGIVWRSMTCEGVSCVSFMLYERGSTSAGSGGRIDVQFTGLGKRTLREDPVERDQGFF